MKCSYCKKSVGNLEAHIKSVHSNKIENKKKTSFRKGKF